jgi:hypothetical protein
MKSESDDEGRIFGVCVRLWVVGGGPSHNNTSPFGIFPLETVIL